MSASSITSPLGSPGRSLRTRAASAASAWPGSTGIPSIINTSVTIEVTGATEAADCGILDNTVLVDADNEPEGQRENNSSFAQITVLCPDITVTKTADADPITVGTQAGFLVTVTNNGAGDAKGVTVSGAPFSGLWPGTLDCTVSATSSGAASRSASSPHCRHQRRPAPHDLDNTANVSATNESDQSLGNNSASVIITVKCPDLGILKEAVSPVVTKGGQANFTVTVTNNGPDTYFGVIFGDTLPGNYNFITVNATSGGCRYNARGAHLRDKRPRTG
jgi:uncharacterized repeat protein (TIGR01451 family)